MLYGPGYLLHLGVGGLVVEEVSVDLLTVSLPEALQVEGDKQLIVRQVESLLPGPNGPVLTFKGYTSEVFPCTF